jgi:hypothetical protein
MKYICNIVTKSKIDYSKFFKVTSNFSSIDTSIPTLIIGWSLVKDLYPNQSILENKITDNIYWTFSKREKRYKYEDDLNKFIKLVLNHIEIKSNYIFYNYILSSYQRKNSFLDYIKNRQCSIYYNSRFLYIYVISDGVTIGISLNDLNYIGIEPQFFIKKISSNPETIICSNLQCIDQDSYFLIKDNTKIIAYLNYLQNC